MNNTLSNPFVSAAQAGMAGAADPAIAGALNAPAAGAGSAADAAYRAKATDAAVKFEGYFISQMLHQMRSSMSALAPKDSAENDPTNRDMLDLADNMLADKLAGQHAFGVADAILRQLLPPASAPQPAGSKLPTKLPTTNKNLTSQTDNIVAPLNEAS
ncbi:MAG TPA: hypothetical protein VGP06_06720 [Janthinobacterium sp.]|jgi:flagellar protein FlgJ|nr:hypothetical protein [Janthinobacterium sp.]